MSVLLLLILLLFLNFIDFLPQLLLAVFFNRLNVAKLLLKDPILISSFGLDIRGVLLAEDGAGRCLDGFPAVADSRASSHLATRAAWRL
jgi:hypothetical protein